MSVLGQNTAAVATGEDDVCKQEPVQYGLWKAFEDLSQEAQVSAQDLGGTSRGGEAETGWADRISRKDQQRRNPIWN